jgi:putative transposase
VEEMNVKGLLKTRLVKWISEMGWLKFLTYLKYKAKWYGKIFIQVDGLFTFSKLCHCWSYNKESLALCD